MQLTIAISREITVRAHGLHNELAPIAAMLTMPYTSFTLAKVKKEFGLMTVEAGRFLPPIEPIAPSSRLQAVLEDLPWAINDSFSVGNDSFNVGNDSFSVGNDS